MNSNRRIALVHPAPLDTGAFYSDVGEPYAIELLAAVLEAVGFTVRLYDFGFFEKADIADIVAFDPFLVGVSLISGAQVDSACTIIPGLRGALPHIHVVAGGVYITTFGRAAVDSLPKDVYCLPGEGEYALPRLAEALYSGSAPLGSAPYTLRTRDGAYVESRCALPTVDLERTPFARRDFAHICREKGIPAIIGGSRGCPNRCSFCCSRFIFDGYRQRSVENIVSEVEAIVLKHDIRIFCFVDDNFAGANTARLRDFSRAIIQRNLRISYSLQLQGMKMTAKLAELLRQSGLSCAFVGLENLDKRMLDAWNKPISIPDTLSTIRLLIEAGVEVQAGYIAFHSDATLEDIYDNARTLASQNILCFRTMANRLMHYPLSPIYDPAISGGGGGIYPCALKPDVEAFYDAWSEVTANVVPALTALMCDLAYYRAQAEIGINISLYKLARHFDDLLNRCLTAYYFDLLSRAKDGETTDIHAQREDINQLFGGLLDEYNRTRAECF